MVDRRRADAVDEAAARSADTLTESYRIVYEQAAEAQERQGRLAPDFSERVRDHLKEQTETGPVSTAFGWAYAHWDNAERGVPGNGRLGR